MNFRTSKPLNKRRIGRREQLKDFESWDRRAQVVLLNKIPRCFRTKQAERKGRNSPRRNETKVDVDTRKGKLRMEKYSATCKPKRRIKREMEGDDYFRSIGLK
jgi:hypothetical protein